MMTDLYDLSSHTVPFYSRKTKMIIIKHLVHMGPSQTQEHDKVNKQINIMDKDA